ncbi:unnamed protein product [Dracunculus medinensis]|uniref:Metalloendopeptidase n=1 Tax=Dracunculus medinensis TaxID=318479 RepID=A0A158Q3U4_DRAME|nr:unnamed protein product [Dracunculus medinensis]
MIWRDGIIPYEMDSVPKEIKLFEEVFEHYRRNTCIRFKKRKAENDFLYITKGTGCYSQVGKAGGKQELSLGRGCLFYEIITHELMHAIGFWHEHSRTDRDDYIRILWENILPGMEPQFDQISAAVQDLLGEKYDYRSIMHYDSTAFSKNGMNTVETIENGFTEIIGSALELSELDIKKINKLYKCENNNSNSNEGPATSSLESSSDPPGINFSNFNESANSNRFLFFPLLKFFSECFDHFSDCKQFQENCNRPAFFFVMKTYCQLTCGHC